ncbi:DegT/DnrJ/EryC1/StrS aminotransferase family protein [Herbaspirillum sp. SJZ107]|uniref:DegT/DnrJ/EryC1/StrS family aminotransferase n=1 Tax=Herbaspirillum sp. SJZ107 TaxID=2572881 RepID=UPI00114EB306|nr:DegT/DnrJ/EryC1/StrS family aminotransferase [Herbaspirillum sp. SJZ107]TQK10925.1 UDP-2-acetamido-2-deoxy-ribo-hexuluronate aminotransferase [Herbaspirillum sp. SJZ107]
MEFIDLKSQYQASRDLLNARIQAVLDHGQYIMGPEVRELEEALARYTGARHCITVASGTEALLIALMALGVGRGDEVITTPFTFIATAEVIVLLGATPVFVDVDPATCNLDAAQIEAHVTPRTRAIIPVSLFGQPADMDEINAVAARHGLPVIEDGAQSFGAFYRGRRSGNLSTVGCTSFFPSKPLGCYGDGGALFTSDDDLAGAMREIRVHGQSQRYVHTRVGVGGRMDTLQCAIVLAKLPLFDWELQQRQRAAASYAARLGGQVRPVGRRTDRSSVYAQYTVVVEQREAVQRALQAAGIPTAVHYPVPVHLQPAYAALSAGADCPTARLLADKVLSLPMGPYLTDADIDRVCTVLLDAVGRDTPADALVLPA